MSDEREPNGNNPLQGSPWWLRAVVWLGAPTVIALGLTWWTATVADAKLTRIEQNVAAAAIERVTQDERARRIESKQDELTRVLLAVCVNAAKDEAARNRCLGR